MLLASVCLQVTFNCLILGVFIVFFLCQPLVGNFDSIGLPIPNSTNASVNMPLVAQ